MCVCLIFSVFGGTYPLPLCLTHVLVGSDAGNNHIAVGPDLGVAALPSHSAAARKRIICLSFSTF